MNIKRWWRRKLYPAIISALAEDIEDGVVELRLRDETECLWEGSWRGVKVVVRRFYPVDYNNVTDIDIDGTKYRIEDAILLSSILTAIKDHRENQQLEAARESVEEKVLTPLKLQIRSQSSELSGLERLLVREIKHLTKETTLAQSDLRRLVRAKDTTTDYDRRLELINARIASLRSYREALSHQLLEVRQLYKQAKEQSRTTNLPLSEEVLVPSHQIGTDCLVGQVNEELQATKAALAALKTA